jgi:hypothetical protein
MAINNPAPYDEFVEFLIQKLTPEEIVAFKASDEAQARARELLDHNNAGTLTSDEAEELQRMLDFERMFVVLKARALKALSQS